jgi:hypothetical protein
MIKQNNKSEKDQSRHQLTGSIIAAILIVSPYLLYIYKGFPVEQTWETFLGVYDSRAWQSTQTSAWILFGKLVPLLLLTIWFFTCKHWWYHAIIVPIVVYCFQIFSFFNDDMQFIDVEEIYWVFPIMLFIAPLVYLTRAKLFNKMRGDDLISFEADLGRKRSVWNQIKELFIE